ncbi:hypothetical protein KCG44_05230 [Pacificimonas sp. WHA3]|uniref:Uncharacterized protein n=1 Tax=Pacificimonas pallii TaxID=2827236 RepID=A0ABS6SCP0_9SPHN|nr:hypothetical protein [Pacificimonas pallii]MBV7256183.1 hypothetical protein [Pacificimonas pallii]
MHIQSVSDRHSFNEAAMLVERFGDEAVLEAATIADAHLNAGDTPNFARWRQVEQAILMLQLVDVVGEVH